MGRKANATAAATSMLFGMAFAELIPEPTDAIYFSLQEWLRINGSTISQWQFWLIQGMGMYVFSALWYLAIALIVITWDVGVTPKLVTTIGLISAGIGVGIFAYAYFNKTLWGFTPNIIMQLIAVILIMFAVILAIVAYKILEK